MMCRWCGGSTCIENDVGDERCSGCGRDWAPVPAPVVASPVDALARAEAAIRDHSASPLASATERMKGAAGPGDNRACSLCGRPETPHAYRHPFRPRPADLAPAEMLAEALESLREADRLSRLAGWPLGLSRAIGDAEEAVAVLKREAEAKHGR